MSEQARSLLTLKITPPAVPVGVLPRAELAARLTAAATGPVTLVSAGPGAGKTLTAASWAVSGASGCPVAWLSLDRSDDDPRSFWSHLIAAIIASGAVPVDGSLREMIPAAEFGPAEVQQVMARVAELPAPVVLVLDDFHEITDSAVLATFGELVDHLPPTVRLVLLSRADPTLRLHRLRVAGQLTEIRTADLAFTAAETVALFFQSGIELDAGQVSVLMDRTEGWPAGLRLAAMSLDPDDVRRGIDRFSGSARSVADYLVGEVTARLPVDERDFLLAGSVVDRINGALADHLTGRTDGHRVLERFANTNAFVVALGSRREWFRFHPLLRELLRHQLTLNRPLLAAELHRRAATWMSGQGAPIQAIRHWILAGDQQQAGRIMLSLIPKLVTPEGPALVAAIDPLAAVAARAPSLTTLLASATRHFARREFRAMLRDTVEARDYLSETAADIAPSAEVVITVFQMIAARAAADAAGVVELAGRVIELLDRTSRPGLPAARAFRALAQVNLAGAQLWTGDHSDAEQLLDAAAAEAAQLDLPLAHLNATGHLAVLDALHGRYWAAERRARDSVLITERRGWESEPQALSAYLALALVNLSWQRPDTAHGHVQRGLAVSGGENDRAVRIGLAITAVQVAVCHRDPTAALEADSRVTAGLARTPTVPTLLLGWAAVAGAEAQLLAGRPEQAITRLGAVDGAPGIVASWRFATLARAKLALDDLPAAEQLLAPLLPPGASYPEPAVTGWLLRAVIATRNRREASALTAVTTAIDLAEPENIRRPFLLVGEHMPELLTRYRQLDGRHQKFANDLLTQLPPQPHQKHVSDTGPIAMQHLTERELMVLHYLPTMLKAGEIGEALFVSVNTVKAHQRAVYRKLGVDNRRAAVEKARNVGLL